MPRIVARVIYITLFQGVLQAETYLETVRRSSRDDRAPELAPPSTVEHRYARQSCSGAPQFNYQTMIDRSRSELDQVIAQFSPDTT